MSVMKIISTKKNQRMQKLIFKRPKIFNIYSQMIMNKNVFLLISKKTQNYLINRKKHFNKMKKKKNESYKDNIEIK